MGAYHKFQKAFKRTTRQQGEQWLEKVPAWMGDFAGTVSTGTFGEIYVRTVEGQKLIVRNTVAEEKYNAPVVIGRHRDQPQIWQVIYDRQVWSQPASTGIKNHHEQHEFPNTDTVWVDRKQIRALTVLVEDADAFVVRVYGSMVRTAGGIAKINTQLMDLSSYTGFFGAKFVNIESDDDGVLTVHEGTVFGSPMVGTVADIPVPDVGKYMIATVLLYEGQTALSDADIRVPFPLESGHHGDMTKAVYDTDDDGVVDNAEALQGHPASDFVLTTDNHYRQLVYEINGSDLEFAVEDGDAVYELLELE